LLLRDGDRLTRQEFHRRYLVAPETVKAELISGVVYMASPARADRHGMPLAKLITWLGTYEAQTPGVQAADNTTVFLGGDSELQPDASLRILPERGGQTLLEDGYIRHAPEWVGEVSSSSARYDLKEKLELYRQHGALEYVVWRVDDAVVDWFVLREGRYVPLPADEDGIVRSNAFAGLWLDVPALLAGNTQRVLAVLQDGLRSQSHAEFVTLLDSFRA
jgi:Uma2 family endonuclease